MAELHIPGTVVIFEEIYGKQDVSHFESEEIKNDILHLIEVYDTVIRKLVSYCS